MGPFSSESSSNQTDNKIVSGDDSTNLSGTRIVTRNGDTNLIETDHGAILAALGLSQGALEFADWGNARAFGFAGNSLEQLMGFGRDSFSFGRDSLSVANESLQGQQGFLEATLNRFSQMTASAMSANHDFARQISQTAQKADLNPDLVRNVAVAGIVLVGLVLFLRK